MNSPLKKTYKTKEKQAISLLYRGVSQIMFRIVNKPKKYGKVEPLSSNYVKSNILKKVTNVLLVISENKMAVKCSQAN